MYDDIVGAGGRFENVLPSIKKINMDKKVSHSLMVANLVATVLVIAIHYNTKSSAEGVNYLIQEFFTNGVARVAVPFFAMMSGYFTALGVQQKTLRNFFFDRSKTLLIPFLIGSLTVLLASMVKKLYYGDDLYFSVQYILKALFLKPESVQFWYLRDLIILTAFSPLIFSVGYVQRSIATLIFAFLWLVDQQPFPTYVGWYFLNVETLFFFLVGGLLLRKNTLLSLVVNAGPLRIFSCLWLWFLLLAIRIYLDPDLNVWYVKNDRLLPVLLYKLSIVVGLLSLIQISTLARSYKWVIYLSGLTFFVYVYHLAPLSYLIKIFTSKIVAEGYAFYINFPASVLLAFLLAHVFSSILPSVFSVVTGGRTSDKALKRI